MNKRNKDNDFGNLPQSTQDFIKLVIKKMRYRKKVRLDVQAELAAHFEDELRDCAESQQQQEKAKQLIEQFGDAKLLGILLRRAKKRCRPLWQKALIRTFQVLLVLAVYFFICLTPLVVGKPEINTDYVQWLNDIVQASHDKEDNAKPLYDKAAEYCVREPESLFNVSRHWPGDLNENELSDFKQWLSKNQKAVELFRKAAEKPYFWFDYKAEQAPDKNEPIPETHRIVTPVLLGENFFPSLLEDLAKYRRLIYIARAYIFLEAYNGDIRQAFDDNLTLLKFGQSMEGKGLLVEQLVGIAIEGLAHTTLTTILAHVDVPVDLLESTQNQIELVLKENKPVLDFEAEKAFWYDNIQRSFTDKGNGSGRALLKALPLVATDWQDTLRMFFTFDLPGRKEVVRDVDWFFEQSSLLLVMPPSRSPDESLLTQKQKDELPLMMKTLSPGFERVSQQCWRLRTGRRGLLATLAVLRHYKDNENYPDNLEQLISAGYLQQVPIDPYTGEPLLYRKVDNGFVLYSVGPNCKDDGGQISYTESGRVKQWQEESDFILWPVQK